MNDELVQLIVDGSIASGDAPGVAVWLNEIAVKNGKTFLQQLGEGNGEMLTIFEQMVQSATEDSL